jgi:hypothetical protein
MVAQLVKEPYSFRKPKDHGRRQHSFPPIPTANQMRTTTVTQDSKSQKQHKPYFGYVQRADHAQ